MIRELRSMHLTCQLSHNEVHERAKTAAEVGRSLYLEKEAAKESAERSKRRIKDLETQGSRLLDEVRTEKTNREVKVVDHYDFGAAQVRTIRLDTQECIESRPMKDSERQDLLPLFESERQHPRDSATFQEELEAFLSKQAEEEARKSAGHEQEDGQGQDPVLPEELN